jgi:hypothetical protein
MVAAAVGSVVLATRDSGEKVTTRGIAAILQVSGHPGSVAAGSDVLWVALIGDPRKPVGDRPLLRLDLATGRVVQALHLRGEVSALTREGGRLIAAVKPVAAAGRIDSRRLVAIDWRSGVPLPLGDSHQSDVVARAFDGPVDQIVRAGGSLWALEAQPGRLLELDPSTLVPLSAPIQLSSGRTLGLVAGAGYLWATATDAGELLRIDPVTRAIKRAHVGGSPVGVAVSRGQVWLADRSGGKVARFDPQSLRPTGDPVRVGGKPNRLAVVGDSLFVADEGAGTVARIDAHSGRQLGSQIRIGPSAGDAVAPSLASTGESLWVSSFPSNTVTRITPQSSIAASSGQITVEGTGEGPVNPGADGYGVTDGGVAGTGRFVATGAITDSGTYTGYRSVSGQTATVRDVLVGRKGTITVMITIHLGIESPPPWTITSGTDGYADLHGRGTLTVDNYQANPYTFVLEGSVAR